MAPALRSAVVCLALSSLAVAGCASDTSTDDDTEEGEDALFGHAAPPIFSLPTKIARAKHPFVLVHAFNGSSTNSWSFNGVAKALRENGQFVWEADIQPYNETPKRADQLALELTKARTAFCAERASRDAGCFDHTKVHMIGHSQGGLDARWVAAHGYGEHTASVTTIGAPHRGTPIGDAGLRALDLPGVDLVADAAFVLLGLTRARSDLARDTKVRAAIYWLSEQRARDPANDIPNVPGVYYQSWAGIATKEGKTPADLSACEGKVFGEPGIAAKFHIPLDLHFVPLQGAFSRPEHVPNDGHIPVTSAKWGDFQGCVPADHLDLIGRPASQHDERPNRTGFDHIVFYRLLAHRLALRDAESGP